MDLIHDLRNLLPAAHFDNYFFSTQSTSNHKKITLQPACRTQPSSKTPTRHHDDSTCRSLQKPSYFFPVQPNWLFQFVSYDARDRVASGYPRSTLAHDRNNSGRGTGEDRTRAAAAYSSSSVSTCCCTIDRCTQRCISPKNVAVFKCTRHPTWLASNHGDVGTGCRKNQVGRFCLLDFSPKI